MLLISCCCVSAPACSFGSMSVVTCWAEGRGVAAPGHLGSIGWEPRLSVATWALPQCCARAQGGHRRLKTSQVLWWRLLLLLCHSMSWFTLCSNFLDMLFFHQKMIHSSQQLGLDSEGKTGGGLWGRSVCEQNSELKRRWIFQKALTLLDEEKLVQSILVAGGAVLSARLRC